MCLHNFMAKKPAPTITKWKRGYDVDRKGFSYATNINMTDSTVVSPKDMTKFVLAYKQRAVKRMRTFLSESERMDTKLAAIFSKLQENGVTLDSAEISGHELERLLNKRKRSKALSMSLAFTKEGMKLEGTLKITPASIRLWLVSSTIHFEAPMYSIVYYRNLIFRDNSLATMVKGTPRREVPVIEGSIPF